MRVAVVAGPDPGHSFPAIALCQRFAAAGDTPTLFTGAEWTDAARAVGIDAVELDGLVAEDDDVDAGARIHRRAARMAVLNVPALRDLAPELVVSDVITAGGGMAAELLGIPWIELNPHPLYLPSKALPPIGSGLAPGTGIQGKLRDTVMRAFTARSWRAGLRQRSAVRVEIGLPARDPGPLRRLIATLPALEVPRPDWPAEAVVVGPLHFEPTQRVFDIPPGDGPVVVVAPSTVVGGTTGVPELALQCLIPGDTLPAGSRLVVSRLGGADLQVPPWAVVGLGQQSELLTHADLVVCGADTAWCPRRCWPGFRWWWCPAAAISGRWPTGWCGKAAGGSSGPDQRSSGRGGGRGVVLAALSGGRATGRGERRGVADPVRVCHEALALAG